MAGEAEAGKSSRDMGLGVYVHKNPCWLSGQGHKEKVDYTQHTCMCQVPTNDLTLPTTKDTFYSVWKS